ncbi:MAG: caspase family protein [Proteobacteria bacterium]|nr:caspase family protein [Pseudomonadota bacterium]
MIKKFCMSLFVLVVCIAALGFVFASDEQRGIQFAPEAASNIAEDFGNYYAIIIGINNYEKWPKLKTAVNDAETLAKTLKEHYGFKDVTLISDKTQLRPTSSNILKSIRSKAVSLTEKDNLLIYYAGHGQVDEFGEGYWIPIEGKIKDVSTWIPHSLIKILLKTQRVKIKNLIMIVDSCYSGTLLGSRDDADTLGSSKEYNEDYYNKLKEKATRKSREVIASGGVELVVDAMPGGNHSLFAGYLISALQDNDRRYVDMATLFSTEVQQKIKDTGKQVSERQRIRTPADAGGLFVLTKLTAPDIPRAKRLDVKDELEKEKKKMLAQLADKKTKFEEERGKFQASQHQLTEDKNRLAMLAEQNKAEGERLRGLLKDKDSTVKSEVLVKAEPERIRIEEERKKIEAEVKKLKERELAQTELAARLQKEEEARKIREEAETQKLALIRKEIEQAEQKKKMVENEKKQLEAPLAKAKDAVDTYTDFEAIKDRFIMRNDGTIIDKVTKRMWLKDANYPMRGMNWENAMKYCESMNYVGHNDWRLPSREEWKALVGQSGLSKTFPMGHPFSNLVLHGNYWTSSVNHMGHTYNIYSVNVGNGSAESFNKMRTGYIWPVRYATEAEMVENK